MQASLSPTRVYTTVNTLPSPEDVETHHTFVVPQKGVANNDSSLPHLETRHAGVTALRRVFIGPSVSASAHDKAARPRSGSTASVAAGGRPAASKGKARARTDSTDTEAASGFFGWARRRRASTASSRRPTGETVPPSASTSRKSSNAPPWIGTSFEIGGDVREAARRRDARLKREREQREADQQRRDEERSRRAVSAPVMLPPRSPASTFGAESFMTAQSHVIASSFAESSTPKEWPRLPPDTQPIPGSSNMRRASEPLLSPPPTTHRVRAMSADAASHPTTLSFSSLAPPSDTSVAPLKSILRGKDQPYANGSALGHGHPSSSPTPPPLPRLAITGASSSSDETSSRPLLQSLPTAVRFSSRLETAAGSGAQPPAPADVVLARGDEQADAAPESFPPMEPRPKELPDDVIKTARMLVRADWSQRDDLPDAYDEHIARKYPTSAAEGWEELGVVWRRGGWLELWGENKINIPAALLGRKKLKAVIPLRQKTTHVSLYSSTDLVFCITHRPKSHGVFHRSNSTPAAPTAAVNTAARMPASYYEDDDAVTKRARHAKASKRAYVHLRSSGTNIFLFRARTHSASKQWMWELYLALGGAVPRMVEVTVPTLGAKVRLPVPQREREDGEGETWAPLTPKEVMEHCVEQLSAVPEWSDLVGDAKREGVHFALAWRRGGVLDWIREDDPDTKDWIVIGGGIAFRQESRLEPVLELRVAMHYPTTCRIPADKNSSPAKYSTTVRISEPPGIEGFLSRHRPKGGTTERVYVASHRGLLFVSRPSTAHPPPPPTSFVETVSNPAAIVLAPVVFGMSNFATSAKQQAKLGPVAEMWRKVSDHDVLKRDGQLNEKQQCRRDWTVKSMDAAREVDRCEQGGDLLAEMNGDAFIQWLDDEERRRAFLQVTDARGFLTLSDVESVEPELSDDHDAKEKWVKVQDLGGDPGMHTADDKTRLKKMRSFIVKTKSGKTARFECHSIEVREEWVDRLRALAAYWHRRERVDAVQLMELSPSAGLVNRIPPLRQNAREWKDGVDPDDDGEPPPTMNEIYSTVTLSHLYNWCILDGCRTVMRQNVMHVKEGLRGVFRLRHVLLLPGTLIEYQSISRDMHGQPLPTPYHRRKNVLSLRDAYVYSGSLTSHLLPSSSPHHWDPGNETEHQFPRCYPGTDGLRTADEAEDCTFVVLRVKHGGNGKNKKFQQAAADARVYRTRSKVERDAFVYAINASIERLLRGEQDREQRLCEFPFLHKH